MSKTWITGLALLLSAMVHASDTEVRWAISEYGEPLFDESMTHWPYATPDAPKGGRVTLAEVDNFDTLNYYVLKGRWPNTIGLTTDSLMTKSGLRGTYLDYGEEFESRYGLIAESVEYPQDLSWAIFTIHPGARYHDGAPIVADDFVFALDTIKAHARPFIKAAYDQVERAEALSPREVKYYFTTTYSMKPLMVAADASPLPVHYWRDRDITRATLEPPLTSGPYRVASVEGGRQIVYERVENYWAKDLPVAKGLNHLGEVVVDYYKDATAAFEAFKAGKVDFRDEFSVKRWEQEYDFPLIKNGQIVQQARESKLPSGMMGYFFNLERPAFQDRRVREAIATLYDFEALQRTLLFGQFSRIKSYFTNTEYASSDVPAGDELAVLEPLRDSVPAEVFEQAFTPNVTDGTGRDRRGKRHALRLLKAAGWEQVDGEMRNAEGEQLSVQLMTARAERVRLASPFLDALKSVGIDAGIRLIDAAQWQSSIQQKEFDLWVGGYYFYPPPDQLLYSYFHSRTADTAGGNSSSIRNPAVDQLIEQIVEARDKPTLLANARALDRVMLWNHYAVPTYFRDRQFIAWRNRFGQPETPPSIAVGWLSTWWVDPELDATLDN
ncbi:MAG: extracellular solute-binding protein [Pseudomonadota bacterium]